MFTGLVQDVGTVEAIQIREAGAIIQIRTDLAASDGELGESIAVDGVCLTVTHLSSGGFHADCSKETLKRSSLKSLAKGSKVHLERALRLGDRFGGHMVAGHVDGVGQVESIRRDGNSYLLHVNAPADLMKYMIEKGSIAISGVSLTINSLGVQSFSVAIIPHSWGFTHFSSLQVGSQVNLEVDMIGKYVERLLSFETKEEENKSSLNMAVLKKYGFA